MGWKGNVARPRCIKFVQHLGQKRGNARPIECRRRSMGYNNTIGFEEVVMWIHARWNNGKMMGFACTVTKFGAPYKVGKFWNCCAIFRSLNRILISAWGQGWRSG